jgi:hypothetical protein
MIEEVSTVGDMSVNICTAETSFQSENCFVFANINTEHISWIVLVVSV